VYKIKIYDDLGRNVGRSIRGRKIKSEMEHQLQIVEASDNKEFISIEFSKAELKRLYNIVYQKHERDIEQNYSSVKIERLRAKLLYFLNE